MSTRFCYDVRLYLILDFTNQPTLMEYFRSFTQSELANLIKETKKELYLCLPSIHEEISGAITYLNNSDAYDPDHVKICIVIDYEPQTFRQGYGDHKEVEYLLSLGFDIKCLKNNRKNPLKTGGLLLANRLIFRSG